MSRNRRSQVDARLLSALAAGVSVEAAARDAECSPSTVTRRLRDERFREQLDGLRKDALDQVASSLVTLARRSIGVLAETLADDSAPPAVKVQAALGALRLVVPTQQHVVLEARLAAAEALLAERAHPPATVLQLIPATADELD